MFFRPRMFHFVAHVSFGYDYNYYFQINSLKSLWPLLEEGGRGGETLPSNSHSLASPAAHLLSWFQLNRSLHSGAEEWDGWVGINWVPSLPRRLAPHSCLSQWGVQLGVLRSGRVRWKGAPSTAPFFYQRCRVVATLPIPFWFPKMQPTLLSSVPLFAPHSPSPHRTPSPHFKYALLFLPGLWPIHSWKRLLFSFKIWADFGSHLISKIQFWRDKWKFTVSGKGLLITSGPNWGKRGRQDPGCLPGKRVKPTNVHLSP